MAKNFTRLRDVGPPAGWAWSTYPNDRNTGGFLKIMDWDYIRGPQWVERMTALKVWLEKYELGAVLSNPAWIRVDGRATATIPTKAEIKLTTHRSTLRKYFGPIKCKCGHENAPHSFKCQACQEPLFCTVCSFSGIVTHVDGHVRVCEGCAGTCEKCGGKCDPNWTSCFKCAPRGYCAACNKAVSGRSYKEYQVAVERTQDNQPVEGTIITKVYCGECKKNLCANCGRHANARTYVPAVEGEVCQSCYNRWFDEFANVREDFEPDELTVEKFLIPVMAGRDKVRDVGVEIEGGGSQSLLAEALFKAKLTPPPEETIRRHGYSGNHKMPVHVEYDASVDWEMVFNRFNPSKKSDMEPVVKALAIAREQVKKGNCHLDLRCGCHIHVDAHQVGMKGAFNLWALFAYMEDVIFRIAASRWATHRSVRYGRDNGAAQPVPKGPYVDRVAFGNALNNGAADRYFALSFSNFWNAVNRACVCGAIRYEAWEKCTCNLGKCTFEFRVFNSTLNPKKLHAYIALSQAFVAKAMTMDEVNADDFPPMEWSNTPLKNMKGEAIDKALPEWEKRLRFMFSEFPLTDEEKESVLYCLKHSDLNILGENFFAELVNKPTRRTLVNA